MLGRGQSLLMSFRDSQACGCRSGNHSFSRTYHNPHTGLPLIQTENPLPEVTKLVEQWLHDCVIGLSLCPYAKAPLASGKVRITVSQAGESNAKGSAPLSVEDCFLQDLEREIEQLLESPDIETTLLVADSGFEDFLDFNDFVGYVEKQLGRQEIDEYLQLASFHPDYLFAGEDSDDASNYTNRAPYPIVQLLRVESVAEAADTGDTLEIPQRNMEKLRALDRAQLQSLFPWVSAD